MGLRSLPFFKAKKGWQFAGGGLPSDGGGGGSLPIATTETLGAVRVGSGLNIANDGTLTGLPFPVPDGYTLRLITYTETVVRPSAWVTLGNIGTAEPYIMFGRGAYNVGEIWCGYIDCKKLSDGTLQCRGVNESTNNYPLTVYAYVLERSE